MAQMRMLALYGPLGSREQAKLLLENQPQVKRIDSSTGLTQLRLFLNDPLSEDELIMLLSSCGISGFRLSHLG